MMKQLLVLVAFCPLLLIAQKSDTTKDQKKSLPYYIELCKDIMTDKYYAFGSKSLLCSENGKIGFILRVSWDYKNGKEVEFSGLTIKSVGIGTCVEKSTLIILFEDDSKIELKAWNDFNCEGNSYMWANELASTTFERITKKKIKAMRFQNGRTMDSYTYKLKENEQSYLLEVHEAFTTKRFVNVKCDD